MNSDNLYHRGFMLYGELDSLQRSLSVIRDNCYAINLVYKTDSVRLPASPEMREMIASMIQLRITKVKKKIDRYEHNQD